ncbi:immunoglobulin-like domain-containing protein [Listeria sp. ILCC797]|uniref:immunoglobulin-like domain-containing protein n=1 Tax=Listeria sp. ILCC797 TaxID=1918333 RepID=UPI000B58E7C2|nr:immunoglobulin-like domain-containing protein [Listeria sp. ILCC797]
MKIKKSRLRKTVISTLVATLFASTIATSLPYNAKATEGHAQEAGLNSSLTSVTSNLLQNPGFVGDGNLITNWDVQGRYSAGRAYYMENYRIYGGSGEYLDNYMAPQSDGSINVTHKRAINNGHIAFLGQNVEVIEGHRYRLSVDYKYVSGSDLEHIQVRTSDFNNNDVEISNSDWLPVTSPTARNYTTTVTAPADITMRIELKVLGFKDAIGTEGTINIGNVSLMDLDAALDQTTINELDTDSVKAEGTAEPNATIEIKAGSTTLGTGRVAADGQYSLTIPKQAVGTVVTATATAYGKTSSVNTTVAQGNIAQTTISALNTDSVKAEGTAEPNATIVIKAGSTTLGTGTASSDGRYSITIPRQEAETSVTATATLNGKTSSADTIVAQGNIAQTTINALDADSVKAEGTAEPNATIVIKAGSTTLATGRVGSDGRYSVTIPKQVSGTIVTATATADGKTSSVNTTVAQGNLAQTTIEPLNTDSVIAVGTAEPNATIVLKDQNNNQLATGRVGSDGRYSLTIQKQMVGTVVTATVTQGGKTSSAFTTVTNEHIAQTTINPLNVDSRVATGTGEPNATIVLKDQHNNQLASGRIASDGAYSLTIPAQVAGTVVTATVTAGDKTSNAHTTVTQAAKSGTVTVKQDFYVGYDSRIQAEVTGDVERVCLEVNGVQQSKVPVTGSFTYYAKNNITSINQTVYLVGLDSANRELDRARVNLKDGQLKIGAVSPNNFVVGTDAYVEGTYTGSVRKVGLSVNGTTLSKVPVEADGKFRYYARSNITNADTDEVFVIGYNSENTEVSRKKVDLYRPGSLGGTITVNPNYYAISDSYVEGTYAGNVKYVSLVVNGTEYSRTSVINTTTWRYYAKDKIATGDTVSVKGYNAAGNVVDQKPVNVVLSPPQNNAIAANDFFLHQDKYISGTYEGSVKYIALKVNGTLLSRIPVPSDGTYTYYARPNITSLTDTVSIVAYNQEKVQVAEAPVRVRLTSDITSNSYRIGDKSVIGTYSGDVKYISATVNGTQLSKIPVDNTGTYSYYIKRDVTSVTDEVIMKGYNASGAVVATNTVRITA